MAEYIEREALLSELAKGTIISSDLYGMGIMSGVDFAMKKITAQPAADVAPVVHGRWEQFFEDWRQQMEGDECSVCGFQLFGGVKDWHYCPNCGAKMMEDSNGFS